MVQPTEAMKDNEKQPEQWEYFADGMGCWIDIRPGDTTKEELKNMGFTIRIKEPKPDNEKQGATGDESLRFETTGYKVPELNLDVILYKTRKPMNTLPPEELKAIEIEAEKRTITPMLEVD